MKKFALFMAVLMLAAMFVACGTKSPATETDGPATGADGDTILIGGLAPLTGAVSMYGTTAIKGAELAFEEINANGGVLGKQIEFEVLDEKGDATEAVNAYNRLTEKNIVALVGDITSQPTLAVAELAAADGLPMITPTASHADITKAGPNIFRVCFLDPYQGTMMARFAAENLKLKKIAVIYNTSDDYSQGVAESFKAEAELLGMEVVASEGYGADDKDFKAQLTSIQGKSPEAVYVPDYYATDALIAAQAREIGLDVPLLGPDGWDGVLGSIDASNIEVLNNCFFSNHYFAEDTAEVVANFFAGYREKYDEEPSSFAALGYDAAYILVNAIEAAGSTDSEAIVEAMAATELEGVTGKITYEGSGDPVKVLTVIEIVDGKYTLFDRIHP